MPEPNLGRAEVETAIRALVDQYRARCLWFAAEDYQPSTDVQRIQAVELIEKHADRAGFVRARELKNWLLQHSKSA